MFLADNALAMAVRSLQRRLRKRFYAACMVAALEHHGLLAKWRGEEGTALVSVRERKPEDLRVVVDLPLEVWRLESRVSNTACLDHCTPLRQPL
jgi:hypothetical protein